MNDTIHEPKISKLSLISSIIGLIILTQFIVLAIMINVKLEDVDYSYAVNFGINWGQGPIQVMDFENNLSCPLGETFALANVKFPGFKSGCFCSPDQYFTSECTNDQLSKGCIYFPESSPKSMVSWGGAACTQRSKTTYFSLNKTDVSKENSSCDKSCGILDTLGSKLCVPANQDCPVNYISIFKSGETPNNIDDNTKSVSFSNNTKTLYYSNNNKDGKIPSQFIVLDHKPCVDSSENRIQFNITDYSCLNAINGKTEDDSWEYLDSMSVEQFVNDNKLDAQMNQYPFYANFKSRQVSLYYRSYIGLNDTCRNLANSLSFPDTIPGQFVNLQNLVKTSAINFLSAASILMFVILLFCLVFKIYSAFNKISSASRLYTNTISAFTTILLMILSLVSTINISNARNTYIWFNNYSDCSDVVNQQLMYNLDSNLQSAYTLGVIFTLLVLILFFLIMIEYLLKHCSDEAPEYQEEVKEKDKILNQSINDVNDIIEETKLPAKDEEDILLGEDKKNK